MTSDGVRSSYYQQAFQGFGFALSLAHAQAPNSPFETSLPTHATQHGEAIASFPWKTGRGCLQIARLQNAPQPDRCSSVHYSTVHILDLAYAPQAAVRTPALCRANRLAADSSSSDTDSFSAFESASPQALTTRYSPTHLLSPLDHGKTQATSPVSQSETSSLSSSPELPRTRLPESRSR